LLQAPALGVAPFDAPALAGAKIFLRVFLEATNQNTTTTKLAHSFYK
jgi:hypothetical protein